MLLQKRFYNLFDKFCNNEQIKYAFAAQKNNNPFDIITTYAVVLTNKRILLGIKRLLFGYFFTTITPDLFNDLKVETGINTIKEEVYFQLKHYIHLLYQVT